MGTQMKKLFLLIVAIGVLFTATAITVPADAAAPPSEKISISIDSKKCKVTATYKWKNYDGTFTNAQVNLYRVGLTEPLSYDNGYTPSGELTASYSDILGSSNEYYASGIVGYTGGWDASTSRTVTMTCRR